MQLRNPDRQLLARRFYALGDEIRLCLLGLLRKMLRSRGGR